MTEPTPALRRLAARRLKLVEDLERVRVELADEIRANLAVGVRQVDIVKITGYTREYIRQLAMKDE